MFLMAPAFVLVLTIAFAAVRSGRPRAYAELAVSLAVLVVALTPIAALAVMS